MADRVYLHIGAPKSGTTYLQSVLWHNRAELARGGLLFPGQNLVDYNMAAAAVRKPRQGRGRPATTWRRLLAECEESMKGHPKSAAFWSSDWCALRRRSSCSSSSIHPWFSRCRAHVSFESIGSCATSSTGTELLTVDRRVSRHCLAVADLLA